MTDTTNHAEVVREALGKMDFFYRYLYEKSLASLDALAREADEMRGHLNAVRSEFGWKRDGRELPDLIREIVAQRDAQAERIATMVEALEAVNKNSEYAGGVMGPNCRFCDDYDGRHYPECEILKVRAALAPKEAQGNDPRDIEPDIEPKEAV